jgi:hypothetical protein
MPNPFLRLQGLFGGVPPVDPYASKYTGVDFGASSPIDARQPVNPMIAQPEEEDLMGGFTPEHTAEDRFNQLASSYPQEGKIGVLRRIAAAVAGLGGPSPAQEQILHGPHNAAVTDWKNQIGPAEQAAGNERYTNVLGANTEYRKAQTKINEKKADTGQQRVDIYGKNVDSLTQARADRSKYDKWKMEHPNHVFKLAPETGHMLAYNPADPAEPPTDMGETSMTQQEIADMNFGHQAAIARIRAGEARATKAAPSDKTNAPLPPSQDKVLENQAYHNYIATKQPGWDQIGYDVDSKSYDPTKIGDPTITQAVATYVKNYKARFNEQRGKGGVGGAIPKASEVPAAKRIKGNSYLMGDGKTTKVWTGNPSDPWK